MKTLMVAAVLASAAVAGTASAQMPMGFKVGTTRAAAIDGAEKAFKRMDQNGNGSFDNAEVTAVLQARATKGGKPFKAKAATRMLQRSDGNGDGTVTLDEFKAAAGTRFDAADANKNGTIDAGEARGGGAAADDNTN